MRGFFEHQYLSFKKDHLRNLIALAKSDGEFHASEEELIYKMGKKYGLKERQISKLIDSEEKIEISVPSTHHLKMDQLYDLMQLVYADGKVDESEIKFCEDIVIKFGYSTEMVPWLVDLFATEEIVTPQEWEEAKSHAETRFIS